MMKKTDPDNLVPHLNQSDALPCAYASQRSSNKLRHINYESMKRVSEVTSLKKGELHTVLKLLEEKKDEGNQVTQHHYRDLINRIKKNLTE